VRGKDGEGVCIVQGRYGGLGPLDFFLILTVVGELKGRCYMGDLDIDGNMI
jgi:hypothetical protein